MSNTCKFDFSRVDKNTVNYSSDKYVKAKAGVGTMFFSSKARPSDVRIVRAYLSADNWLSSVDDYTRSAEIVVSNRNGNCDTFRLTIEDARQLLEALPSIISDAEQIKEALTKVLPAEEAEDFDDDDNDDDDNDD